MPFYKDQSAADRLAEQAKAKKAMLERFRAKPGPDDPEVMARIAERKAIAEARDKRAAERRAAKEAEAARIAADKALIEAEKQREAAELEAYLARKADDAAAANAEHKARALALAAEQKAARDARYARRKAR